MPQLLLLYRTTLNTVCWMQQIPQELAELTMLTHLSLERCWAPVAVRVPPYLFPKMQVTEEGCRFLRHFPVLAALRLSVTKEERAALAGFLAKLQVGKCSTFRPDLTDCEGFCAEGDLRLFCWI